MCSYVFLCVAICSYLFLCVPMCSSMFLCVLQCSYVFLSVLLCSPCSEDQFELVCDDGTLAPLQDFERCNWGVVPSNAIVTTSAKSKEQRRLLQDFLKVCVCVCVFVFIFIQFFLQLMFILCCYHLFPPSFSVCVCVCVV